MIVDLDCNYVSQLGMHCKYLEAEDPQLLNLVGQSQNKDFRTC